MYYVIDRRYSQYMCLCSSCKKTWGTDKISDIEKCPHCHRTDKSFCVGILNGWNHEIIENGMAETKIIDETTISGKTTVTLLDFSREKQKLTLRKEDVLSYSISLAPTPVIELKINGIDIEVTKCNLKKALMYVSAKKFPNTIFGNLRLYGTSTLFDVIIELIEKPWIMKLYEEGDKHLNLYEILSDAKVQIDNKESSIIEALHISKSLFSFLMQNCNLFHLNSIGWNTFMKLVERYGSQTTEQICLKTVEICQSIKCAYSIEYNEFYESKIFVENFFKLLLLREVQYDYKQLANYLVENLYTYQAIESPGNGAQLLLHYIELCRKLGVPFEQYPRSLKLAHDIAEKNQKRIFDEKIKTDFSLIVNREEYQSLQYTGKDYMIIAPKCLDDIVLESIALGHCVDSYINKVINQQSTILFMRNISRQNKALIILDIRKHHLYQVTGQENRELTAGEESFILEWGRIKCIDCNEFC